MDMAASVVKDVAMTSSNKTRPGWFSDGQPAGMERYWTGTEWSAKVRPIRVKSSSRAGNICMAVTAVLILLFVGNGMSGGEWAVAAPILVIVAPIVLVVVVLWLLWRAGNRKTVVVQQASTQLTGGVPAGWYPDMNDPTLNRWYDGTVWTSATLPK